MGDVRSSVRVCAAKTIVNVRRASAVVTAAGRATDQKSTDQWVVQDLIPAVFITDGAVAATQAIEMQIRIRQKPLSLG